jgi:AAA ATPase-like protein
VIVARARRPHVDRSVVVGALVERAREPGVLVVGGPPGAGKTTLLLETADALEAAGWLPVHLDLMGAASSPERFVEAALRAMPASVFGVRLPEATAIRRLADQGKKGGAAAVEALFALWASLDEAGSRPVVLLLDEITEIRSLAYFAGLREAARMLGAALGRRRRGTIVATSYSTQARQLWPAWEPFAIPALGAAELAAVARAVDADPAALVRACGGSPRYLQALWDALVGGSSPADAWVQEMRAGGRLEQAARHTYETLLLRSRGYGMSKALLGIVAEDEGLNLTALVRRVGRSAGAVRDYLGWLVGVDAVRAVRKRYFYVDGIVAAARRIIDGPAVSEAAVELAPSAHAAAEPAPPTLPRADTLMEID